MNKWNHFISVDRIWIGLDRLSSSSWTWLDGTPYTVNQAHFADSHQDPQNNKCIQLILTSPSNANFAKFDDFQCGNQKYGLCQITN